MADSDRTIDVRRLLAATTVEEACVTAERYFSQLRSWDHHLAKPFSGPEDAPSLLVAFAALLQGLSVFPGMDVLDFGAGTCWTTRFLAQMGARVTAVDVSRTALAIGEELLRRQPLVGDRVPPRFLLFDGHRLDLPAASMDRVFCLDAFHHVPNQGEVLAELARVLRDGGVAGFSEPGPEHSESPQSQYEMRTFGVIENDVRLEEIWELARPAGFTGLTLAAYSFPSLQLSLAEYGELLSRSGAAAERFAELSRTFMGERRTFFLAKGTPQGSAEQYRSGLKAALAVAPADAQAASGEPMSFTVTAVNVGTSTWRPHATGPGGVFLGAHLYDERGVILRHSYHWEPLVDDPGRAVAPGESVVRTATVPAPPAGRYLLEFDLVAADVLWFGLNGSETPRVTLDIARRP